MDASQAKQWHVLDYIIVHSKDSKDVHIICSLRGAKYWCPTIDMCDMGSSTHEKHHATELLTEATQKTLQTTKDQCDCHERPQQISKVGTDTGDCYLRPQRTPQTLRQPGRSSEVSHTAFNVLGFVRWK